MSSPDIAGIIDNSRELDRLRSEQEDILVEINKIHKKLQASPEIVEKHGDGSLNSVSNALLHQLDSLLPPGPQGQQRRRLEGSEPKRKRMKHDTDMVKIRSQIEACASLKGEQVAAKVTGDNVDKDEWFVVKVIHFDRDTKEFDVLDEEPGDDEEGAGQRKYKLPMSCIIPFPKRNDLSHVPDFPPGRHVLAVYPGTTALYKATVVGQQRKRKTDDYMLEFDDDEEDGALPKRIVPFHKVVPLPEGHRQ